jgi:hypothetical protein
MFLEYAPMVKPSECENKYLEEIFENIKDYFPNYWFLIARTNNSTEISQLEETLRGKDKVILILKSDEAGITPPFLDKYEYVFRTYNRKSLCDFKKIFPIPCGYASEYDYAYNTSKYKKLSELKPLKDREYDIFYSAQSYNRAACIKAVNNIKDKYKSIINITHAFAQGFSLQEYYEKMSSSKISIVPKGAVVPESFRYFESFHCNNIVITTYPKKDVDYNLWYYEKSPAIFLNSWNELTVELIESLLNEDTLNEFDLLNQKYYNKYISPKAVAKYILKITKRS